MELEWFVTTTYNHAIDLYSGHEDEMAQKWIGHAFTLVHYLQDGGELERQLQERYANLSWGD